MTRTPLRCAFVNHYTGYGGAELMLLTLLERIDRDRVAPILIAPGEGLLTERARELGLRVQVAPIPAAVLDVARAGADSTASAARAALGLPLAVARTARAISRAKAEIVVTNSAKAHVYGTLAGRLVRRPVVWRIHDTMDSPDFGGTTRRLLLTLGRHLPARILTVSDSTAKPLLDAGVPPARVSTLYNGIDLEALRAAVPQRRGDDGGPPRIGSVGRLTPLKGHGVFIDAAAQLVSRGVDAHFVIAGAPAREAPDHARDLRARADELGLAGRVEIICPFDDLAGLLSSLDLLVHGSVLPDSLPTTVIESMALGRPIVATALGGVPELVQNGRTGFLIPPDDAGEMAEAIERLLASPDERAAAGAAASADASARFDVATFVDIFASELEMHSGR
ncbi:MAG: glycosyltransferase family 4 protein [Thermoleophilia bacterium]